MLSLLALSIATIRKPYVMWAAQDESKTYTRTRVRSNPVGVTQVRADVRHLHDRNLFSVSFSLGEIRMSSANQRCEIRILSLARAPRDSPRATSAFGNPKIGFENGHFAEIRAEIRRSTIGRIRHKNRCNDPNFHDPTCDAAKNVLPPNQKSRGANASQQLRSFCWFG